jgi:hypothetical protein
MVNIEAEESAILADTPMSLSTLTGLFDEDQFHCFDPNDTRSLARSRMTETIARMDTERKRSEALVLTIVDRHGADRAESSGTGDLNC